MAAFIKRILRNNRAEHQRSWADYKERQQFELKQRHWKDNQWFIIL